MEKGGREKLGDRRWHIYTAIYIKDGRLIKAYYITQELNSTL